MNDEEKKMHDALISLSKKFEALWQKVYFVSLSKVFAINIPAFSQHEVIHIEQFCKEYNLTWSVMRENSEGGKGISISFYPVV